MIVEGRPQEIGSIDQAKLPNIRSETGTAVAVPGVDDKKIKFDRGGRVRWQISERESDGLIAEVAQKLPRADRCDADLAV